MPFNGRRAQIAGTYTTGQELPVVDPDLFKVSEGPAHPVLEIRGRPGLANYFSHFLHNLIPSGRPLVVFWGGKTGDDVVTQSFHIWKFNGWQQLPATFLFLRHVNSSRESCSEILPYLEWFTHSRAWLKWIFRNNHVCRWVWRRKWDLLRRRCSRRRHRDDC